MIIYEDETGYIKGSRIQDYWYIHEFVVYEQYRGQGKARALAAHIPANAELVACPVTEGRSKGLKLRHLVHFYESLGFKRVRGLDRRTVKMRRRVTSE